MGGFLYFEQFVKKGAVMDHGDALLLSAGFVSFTAHRDSLGSPIIVYDSRVIDRNVGSTALKITHRIAAL